MLVTRRPPPPLASYVEGLWHYDGSPVAHQRERVLPNGRFQMVIDLASGRGTVCGMRSQYIEIDPSAIRSVIGVVFRAGGARAFFGAPTDFYNQVVPLDDAWGSDAIRLGERLADAPGAAEKLRLLETALLETMNGAASRRLALHPSVEHGLRAFRHMPHVQSVIDVSADAGVSRRRFSELFREQIGMTPKLYCRLLRFRDVVRRIVAGAPVDWADVALAGGYCDQAHLSHEFRDFSGMSPSSYLAAERPFANHVRVD
jgi:AraC-like DNA-binding protein